MFSTITARNDTNIAITVCAIVATAIIVGVTIHNHPDYQLPPVAGQEISESYYKKVQNKAWLDCKRAIEKLATYDLRWTTWGSIPFSRYNKYQRADGIVRLSGDDAEAQNGFGGWIRVNYACEFNPATNQVVNVSMHQGRLPN